MSTQQARTNALQQQPLKVITMGGLLKHDFRRREYLLHPWLRQGKSAMIWAQSGLGKTMLTLTMALAVAGGGSFLNWSNQTGRKVLLVDGEMHGEDLKDRLEMLIPTVAGLDRQTALRNINILSRQKQHGETRFPDLGSPEGQQTVRRKIAECGAELVILDNFSTLCEVADENEASAMNPLLAFLLMLKQADVACVLVHHSGKTGSTFRGSSKLATTFEAIMGLKPWEGVGSARTSIASSTRSPGAAVPAFRAASIIRKNSATTACRARWASLRSCVCSDRRSFSAFIAERSGRGIATTQNQVCRLRWRWCASSAALLVMLSGGSNGAAGTG